MRLAAAAFLPLGRIALVGSVASVLALVAFVGVNGTLIRLGFMALDCDRPFRVPLSVGRWPVLPALAIVLCVVLAARLPPLAYAIAAGPLLLGALMGPIPWRGVASPSRGARKTDR